MHIVIIDPSSSEFNRGSFCYAPYLTYNGLIAKLGYKVTLMETFVPEDFDKIPNADAYFISLWSYPQVETAMLLQFFLQLEKQQKPYFVGYTPMIRELGLTHVKEFLGFDPLVDPEFLKQAMFTYPMFYKDFKRLLLSDCDMHLKHLEKNEKVYPLFTSYGCPNGCAFCPSTRNCEKTRVVLSFDDVCTMLDVCCDARIMNIHFTDEDFFYDIERAAKILYYIAGRGMHLIALGSAKNVFDFIEAHGTYLIADAGLEVIEIGFESGSEDLSQKMGVGKSLSDCENLAMNQKDYPFNIFWLVQTFFPGETIKTLNDTGRFMREHGFTMNEVVGRLRTNGTKGGLGQFFQPYYGTPLYGALRHKGTFLTERPIRLIPSYLPNSFMDSEITEINPSNYDAAINWLMLYNVSFDVSRLRVGTTLRYFLESVPVTDIINNAIALAILARFEVIK
jgi:hypothetical protein